MRLFAPLSRLAHAIWTDSSGQRSARDYIYVRLPAYGGSNGQDGGTGDGAQRPASSVLAEDAPVGVQTVEAAEKVYGRYSKWWLFIGLALASYIYSLDGSTTYTYLAYAVSTFERHTLISSIQVVQAIIIACGKPVMAKLADTTSRGTAFIVVLLFYVFGYIVIASAGGVGSIVIGIILYAVGYTGLQLLTQIIIADITTLKWRGLVSGLSSAPFIVNAYIGANISAAVLQHSTWRWGYGMFAILVPMSLAPLIITLHWAERKAQKLGLAPPPTAFVGDTLWQRFRHFAEQLDLVGLMLLGTAIALILLPLTAKGKWYSVSMPAMLVLGCAVLCAFIAWDTRLAQHPILPARILANRAFVGAAWIGFLDFASFYLTNTYLYSFVLVVKPWPLTAATYFTSTQTVALTLAGILAGLAMRVRRRYKRLLVGGLCVRALGVALMLHSRGAAASDAEIVLTQVLQGLGGGAAAVASQVGAQASVAHADVAVLTAVVLLWIEIGGGVGSAFAGAIWTHTLPARLADHLPQLNATARAELFGSIDTVLAYPRGDPVREGVIAAYDDTMKVLCAVAMGVAVLPIILAFGMPDFYLGDKQNAIDESEVASERGGDDGGDEESTQNS